MKFSVLLCVLIALSRESIVVADPPITPAERAAFVEDDFRNLATAVLKSMTKPPRLQKISVSDRREDRTFRQEWIASTRIGRVTFSGVYRLAGHYPELASVSCGIPWGSNSDFERRETSAMEVRNVVAAWIDVDKGTEQQHQILAKIDEQRPFAVKDRQFGSTRIAGRLYSMGHSQSSYVFACRFDGSSGPY